MVNKTITNDALYDRLDSIRLELKQDIVAAVASVAQNQGRLEAKFDALEAGRLTRAEAKISDLQVLLQKFEGKIDTNEGKITTKVAILWGIAGGAAIVAAEVILNILTRTR